MHFDPVVDGIKHQDKPSQPIMEITTSVGERVLGK
jgi:hypothetical protein